MQKIVMFWPTESDTHIVYEELDWNISESGV